MRVKYAVSCAVILAVLAWCAWCAITRGSDIGAYPSKYLALICPFSAGGGTDLLSRTCASELSKSLGKPVAVFNITGGAGTLGFIEGAGAPADGYTLTMLTFEINTHWLRGFTSVSAKDFEIVALLNSDPACIAVPVESPIKDISDFARAGKSGERLTVGNSGIGGVWHLASESFARKLGIETISIPFEGASGAITAMLGSHIEAVCAGAAELKRHVDSGKIRVLAVMDKTRVGYFPDVPTCAETGTNLRFCTWRAVAVPRGTPQNVIELLAAKLEDFSKSGSADDFAKRTGTNIAFRKGDGFLREISGSEAELKELMERLKLL